MGLGELSAKPDEMPGEGDLTLPWTSIPCWRGGGGISDATRPHFLFASVKRSESYHSVVFSLTVSLMYFPDS